MRKLIHYACFVITFFLGILGLILPLVPSSPFFILSLMCLWKANKKLVRRFLEIKIVKRTIPERIRRKYLN